MADQGLDLGAYLAQLKEERARLDIIIADVARRLGVDANGTSGSASAVAATGTGAGASVRESIVTGRVRSDEFFRMSIPEAVKRFLEIIKQPQSPTAIVNALKAGGVLSQSKNFYTTVWTALRRLRAAGELVNTPSGWGLSVWYPNKPKASGDETKQRKGKKRPKAARAPKKPARTAKPAPRQASGWHGFVAEQMKAGKTMKEAAEVWRKKKPGD